MYNDKRYYYSMDQERLRMIVHNLELLVNSLKEEIKEPSDYQTNEMTPYINEEDIDEYYSEEDDV